MLTPSGHIQRNLGCWCIWLPSQQQWHGKTWHLIVHASQEKKTQKGKIDKARIEHEGPGVAVFWWKEVVGERSTITYWERAAPGCQGVLTIPQRHTECWKYCWKRRCCANWCRRKGRYGNWRPFPEGTWESDKTLEVRTWTYPHYSECAWVFEQKSHTIEFAILRRIGFEIPGRKRVKNA